MSEKTLEEILDITEVIIRACGGDESAKAHIVAYILDKSYTSVQKIPYLQLKSYLEGVKKVEDGLGEACRLSDKLFSNPKTRNDNALRVYKIVVATDTSRKMEYLINTTKSMLMGCIDIETMFRIYGAITENLPEDLEYLSEIIEKQGPYVGNIKVHALVRSGLMISAGIDAGADVEEQEYVISSLGYLVDCYAISLGNEQREQWYKDNHINSRLFEGPMPIPQEEIERMFTENFNA